MTKRALGIMTCFILILAMLPSMVFADTDPEYWVGGTEISAQPNTDAEGDGWSWHSSKKLLTLSDAAIRGINTTADSANSSAVCLPTGSTVKLEGDNTLLGGAATGTAGKSAGIYCKGALTITSGGALTSVGGDTANTDSADSYGIYADGNITFDTSFTGIISAVGGTSSSSVGICSKGKLTVTGPGSIAATGGNGKALSHGMSCVDMIVSGSADITATGGQVDDANGNSCGISSTGAEFIATGEDPHITATGGAVSGVSGKSYGIVTGTDSEAYPAISNGANVTAVGGDANQSAGVYTDSPKATFSISGGALLTSVGGNASSMSCGMILGESAAPVSIERKIVVTNGALVTKGGLSGDKSHGIYAYSGGGVATKLSFDETGNADRVIVGYATKSTGTSTSFTGFTDLPTSAETLKGSADASYAIYGKGIYAEKDNSGNYTHVFDSAQDKVPNAKAPFVIIDGNGNGAQIQGYALKTSDAAALSGASPLSGISVLIAGQNNDGESSGLEYNNSNSMPLQVSGEGDLVSIGGNTGNGDFATSSGVKIASGGLKISDSCDLTAIGGTTKGTFAKSCGLFADNINASGNVNLTAIGGTSADYISYGILGTSNNGGFDFSSSTVSAVGGKGDDGSCGISSAADIDNSGASLTAIGGYVSGTNGRGYGVECNKKISIDAGSLRTVGGAVSNNSVSSIGLAAIKLTVIDSSISNVGGSSITSVGTQLQDTLALNSGGISTVGTTGAGTTGQSSGLLLLVEKPQFSDVSDSGVLTAFGGSAESGGSYGINLYMNHKLALSNVNVTASGNTRAVNLSKNNDWSHPEFKLSGVSAKVSTNDVTGSNAAAVPANTTDYSSYKYMRTIPTQLTVTGTKVQNKVYDGNNKATVILGTVSGISDDDDVKVTATGTFNDKSIGNGKTVTVRYTLSGKDAAKYLAPEAETLSADITKATPAGSETSTGDNTPLFLLIALALMTAAAVTGVAIKRKGV